MSEEERPVTPQNDLMGEFFTPTRSAVVLTSNAWQQAKHQYPWSNISQNDIFSLFNIPARTGKRWINQQEERKTGKFRPGRSPKCDKEMLDVVEDWIIDNGYPARTQHWQEICEILELPIRGSTLRRNLAKRGLHKFKAAQKKFLDDFDIKRRLDFALLYLPNALGVDYWKHVVFTDEFHVSPGQKNAEWVTRRRGERYLPSTVQFKSKRKDAYFHCFIMIGFNFKSSLFIYGEGKKQGNVTQQFYRDEILEKFVLPYIQEARQKGNRFILEEDNDGGHGTRSRQNIVQTWREKNQIEHYCNPPHSPDFSPVENVIRICKQRTKKKKTRTINELRDALYSVWEGIAQSSINKLCLTMPARMEECVQNEGLHTRY